MERHTPGWRLRFFTSFLLVLGLVLALATGEVVVRAARLAPHHESATARLVDGRWRDLLDCYPSNPRGYFDLDLRDPATRERFLHLAPLRYDTVARRAPHAIVSHYNRLRFRDREPGPKAPGVRRVVVVGDSFTEGQGVKEPDTLPRLLEGFLEEKTPAAWEVRNCGRRGLDFPELLEGFEAALSLDPDVVVYAMVLNDVVRAPEFDRTQPYVNDYILDRYQLNAPFPAAPGFFESRLLALVRDRIITRRVGRETTRWYLEMYGPGNASGWGETRSLIREMRARTEKRGGRFVLALWPLLAGLDGSYPFGPVHEEVRRFCQTVGIEHVDLLEALRGQSPAELWVHAVDMHPNDRAQRLAARLLATRLGGPSVTMRPYRRN